ncbi:hypothetical protein BJV78DRAFT_1296615 [Lactifluus subvellereus]|nr:hypothetical protein BJV78DRAFT_1296615 [Lactifluus subvellereus]
MANLPKREASDLWDLHFGAGHSTEPGVCAAHVCQHLRIGRGDANTFSGFLRAGSRFLSARIGSYAGLVPRLRRQRVHSAALASAKSLTLRRNNSYDRQHNDTRLPYPADVHMSPQAAARSASPDPAVLGPVGLSPSSSDALNLLDHRVLWTGEPSSVYASMKGWSGETSVRADGLEEVRRYEATCGRSSKRTGHAALFHHT